MKKAVLCAALLLTSVPAYANLICSGSDLLFSPDNRYFAAGWGIYPTTLSLGTVKDRKYFKSVNLPDGQCLFRISPDSKRLAASPAAGTELLFLSMRGEVLGRLPITGGGLNNISRSFRYAAVIQETPKGNSVFTISRLSGDGFTPQYTLDDMSQKGWSEFSPDDRYFAYYYGRLGRDGQVSGNFINVLDLKSGKSSANLYFKDDFLSEIRAMRFSADGKLFAFGSVEGETRVVSVPGGKLVKAIKDRGHGVQYIRFSREYMAVISGDGEVKVYSLPGFQRVYFKKYDIPVHAAEFTADGAVLGVLFESGMLNFTDLGASAGAQPAGR
jgi:WD40 repeat protein